MEDTVSEELRKVLSDVGITLTSNPEDPLILHQEQALVVRELSRYVQSNVNKEFLKNLQAFCRSETHFRKFLSPTKFQKAADSDTGFYQDSLFSIFLKVPDLQDDVIELLLESITSIATKTTEDTSWLRTLLKPLRCIPTLNNGSALAEKLLDILEISTFACQLEILEAIPEIIPDSQCDLAAKQLTVLLKENEELCGAIVDCLTALNLETDVKAELYDRILARILVGVSFKAYHILIKFVLSDFKSQNLPTLIKIRNSLDNLMGGSFKENGSDKTVIFYCLQNAALTQKLVAEGWLNTISSFKLHSDHKPIDFLIMFMLHKTCEMRKRIIEAIFRKRVSLGLFKEALLQRTFDKYLTQQLLKDYIRNIMQIGCCLLRFAKDEVVAKFAICLFESLFKHQYTSAVYRGEILSNLISLTGSNDHHTVSCVLQLVLSLVRNEHQKMQTHIVLLMLLLEKLDTLDLKDVKIVFNILCSLLCGEKAEESFSGFKDQLYNIIRKQLSCSQKTVKHKGIISAIVMVKHTASVESEQISEEALEKSELMRKLAPGPAKEAADLLELVSCACEHNPGLMCLYYDQLASILASELVLNKHFLYWLYKKVEDDFQATFLTEATPEGTDDVHFSMQYMLNRPEETDTVFSINIAGDIFCEKTDNILLLASNFRVLRLLHFRQHSNLSEIDSLLGCGVILPDVDAPDELEPNQIAQVIDSLFHCVNWFREVINAFVTQKDALIQERVVKRLDDLLEVERKLQVFLKQMPGHNLPLSYLHSMQTGAKPSAVAEPKPVKPPRKKIKSAPVVTNETCNITVNTQQSIKSVATGGSSRSSVSPQFREMDTDLICLIKYPLKFDEDELSGIHLNICQLKFIFADFISKLLLVTRHKNMGLSHLNDVSPEHLMRDCVRIVRNINKFLDIIVKKIDQLLEEGTESYCTDEASDVKTCLGDIFEIYYLIFQWQGFQHSGNADLLKSILKSAKNMNSQTMISINKLVLDFAIKMNKFEKHCLHLSHATSLIRSIEAAHSLTAPTLEIKKILSSLAQTFLSRRWYDHIGKLDQGQACNQHMDILIKAYLKDISTEAVTEIVDSLLQDIESLEPKDGCLPKLPAIDRKNFHVFYLELCNRLLDATKIEIQSLSNAGHLTLWRNVATAMVNLMEVAKIVQNRTMACFMKKANGILKVFLNQGIPMMEIMMKMHTDEVYNILKTIQATTRFLHHLCCTSKVTRDASVVAHIPSFKLTIESIIYRVKAALVANNCSSAFWMGNLRNKGIDGQDIMSQSTTASSSDCQHEMDTDQLPSEDDDDQNIINQEHLENDSMESEVFG
ncbi:Fanconi anemia group D2 protein homolog [Dendroctonus ponderosae]|uniref:Fanconi anemia group D2 protein homolog n=1 Tax=Dendroctonus ponderosae TaxID=77166 RepID=UPI002035D8A9|nr:Fanconi anemia group D2 protein homolog [Dendroctonus ponderosae]XP_048521254.1 Fanconi anemia group D2 protein homolog [Dendroctonus ponderosae]KAH1024215.1 hypothetical protein HUJ05_003738 [Dendroctonus ponderosae]